MSTGLARHNRKTKKTDVSEEKIHRWLQGADLSRLSHKLKFKRTTFPHLQPTQWDKLYEDFQKSKPKS